MDTTSGDQLHSRLRLLCGGKLRRISLEVHKMLGDVGTALKPFTDLTEANVNLLPSQADTEDATRICAALREYGPVYEKAA